MKYVRIKTYSWASGTKVIKLTFRLKNQDDVMAAAMWLAKHGKRTEGDDLIDEYCDK